MFKSFSGRNISIYQWRINCAGYNSEKILFTSADGFDINTNPLEGDWGQIKFFANAIDATFSGDNYSSGSILEYCIIEYGQGVYLDSSHPFINNCTIRYHSTNAGITQYDSVNETYTQKITNNQIHDNDNRGIY